MAFWPFELLGLFLAGRFLGQSVGHQLEQDWPFIGSFGLAC